MILDRVRQHRRQAKEEALRDVRNKGAVSARESEAMLSYWSAVLKRVEQSHEPGAAQISLTTLHREMEELKQLRSELNERVNDPTARAQIPLVDELLRRLELIVIRMERRWWTTKRAGWAYVASLNTAFPKHHPLLGRDPKKDKPKTPPPEPRTKQVDEEDWDDEE